MCAQYERREDPTDLFPHVNCDMRFSDISKPSAIAELEQLSGSRGGPRRQDGIRWTRTMLVWRSKPQRQRQRQRHHGGQLRNGPLAGPNAVISPYQLDYGSSGRIQAQEKSEGPARSMAQMSPGPPQDDGQNQPLTRRVELGRIERWARGQSIAMGNRCRAPGRKYRRHRPVSRTHLPPAATVEIAAESPECDAQGQSGRNQIEQRTPGSISLLALEPCQRDQATCDGSVEDQATPPEAEGFQPVAGRIDLVSVLDQVPDSAADDPKKYQQYREIGQPIGIDLAPSGPGSKHKHSSQNPE